MMRPDDATNKIKGGNIHKTKCFGNKIVQQLNPKFSVPAKNSVNKVIKTLKENGIEAAYILKQNKKERVMERLDGDFYDTFTDQQCVLAGAFLRKLHIVLDNVKTPPTKRFEFSAEFSPSYRGDVIWGDLKPSNILWRNGQPIGMVDYDTIVFGSCWFDLMTALIMWQEVPSKKTWKLILESYAPNMADLLTDCVFQERLQKWILLHHRKLTRDYLGIGYMNRSKSYLRNRLLALETIYDKSVIWRSI